MDGLLGAFRGNAHGADLDAVVREAGQELLHYARLITGNAESAEDALHDTLVALLQQGAAARNVANPRAWLFTVLRRKAFAYRRARRGPLATGFAEGVEGDPAQRLILAEALGTLDEAEQETIILHLWEGLTFEDIGEVLGSPRGTVLSRYHRAIQRLRERLEGVPLRGMHMPVCERSAS